MESIFNRVFSIELYYAYSSVREKKRERERKNIRSNFVGKTSSFRVSFWNGGNPWIANRLKPFNVYTTRTMLTKRARNADKKRARNGRTPTRAKVGRRTVASAEARSGWRGAWRAGDEAPPTNSAVKCDAVGVLPRRQSGRVSLREAAWWGRGGVSGVWVSFERSVPGDATLVARFSFTLPVFHCSRFPAACAYTTVSLPVRGRKTRRSSRLGIVTATPPRAIFEQGIGRRESHGERWMDFRIPPEGVRFGR